MLEVVDVKCLGGYKLWLQFNNERSAEVDLENQLWGPAFEFLKAVNRFKEVTISKELGTITWNNEVDFAPEFLYSRAFGAAS